MRDKVTRQVSTNHNLFEKRGELKQNWAGAPFSLLAKQALTVSKLVFIIPSTLYWGKAALHCRCAERLGERERERERGGREREKTNSIRSWSASTGHLEKLWQAFGLLPNQRYHSVHTHRDLPREPDLSTLTRATQKPQCSSGGIVSCGNFCCSLHGYAFSHGNFCCSQGYVTHLSVLLPSLKETWPSVHCHYPVYTL